jgi:predicted dehydrogenase
MKKLRGGFVGAGTIMAYHARNLMMYDDVELVAVADVMESTLHAVADEFGIPQRYLRFEEMFQQEELDFAVICVPNAFHAQATIAALQGGGHVLCEKPPAMNAAQAKDMADTAKAHQRRLFYGLHMRFMPEIETGRQFFDSGRLGEVYHASVQLYRRRGIPGLGSWFTTKAMSGGGALIDMGVHLLDRTHYLMGLPRPVAVSGVTHAKFGPDPANYRYLSMWGKPVPGGPFDVDDLVAALIRFETGASLVLQVSWAANTPDGNLTQVLGTKGGLYFGSDEPLKVFTEDSGFIADIEPKFRPSEAHAALTAHFVEALRNPDLPLRTTPQEGLVLQTMLDAIYESAETGREVVL